jgi:hypothetical protein
MYDRKHDGTFKTKSDYEAGQKPTSVTLTVKKVVAGMVAEFTASIAWAEYIGSAFMHQKMPFTMADKTAEMHALRMAFPELGQLYSDEEVPVIQGEIKQAVELSCDVNDNEAWINAISALSSRDEAKLFYNKNKEFLTAAENEGLFKTFEEKVKTLTNA